MAVVTSSVAGIVSGLNPLEYSASSPYTIFLFQAVFIILLCQLINYPISMIRQPRVISEVIAGILLGPSVFGHIPNFTKNCFPPALIPGLTLFANIGIILFLFIVGMEVDIGFIKKNLRVAVTVGLINMAVPFGLGCAIAVGIYNEYKDDSTTSHHPIKFTTYMVFIAVALCITAFPVLARILTELNLIGDRVGTIVLAAGITNDLTGWILLALVVTLANALNGVNTVYILLLTAGWFLFLTYPVRLGMRFIITRFSNDLSTGEPLQMSMVMILVTVFISAFFTNIIGVHPIFGAFMAGVIVPRDNGFVIKITEKLEDLVHIVLIPIYFALAGLGVNLGLLDRGIDWAYTIGIIVLAMIGKVSGGLFAAKLNGLFWRESLAVGVLMSCKGIVEIVVLNVGLSAGIISQRVYSMFIVMALVTTFLTTPLALWCYPVSYREKRDKFVRGEINWDESPKVQDSDVTDNVSVDAHLALANYDIADLSDYSLSKVVLLLKKIDTVSYLMAFIKSFSCDELKAIHLREFGSRTSNLLEALSAANGELPEELSSEFNNSTSLLAIVTAFGELLGMHCTTKSILSTFRNYIFSVNDQISDGSNFLVTTIKLNQLEDTEKSFYSQVFHNCKLHFGLLLINDKAPKLTAIHESSNSDLEEKYTTLDLDARPRELIDFDTLHLVLNHDNLLSSSDKLALHLVYRLISPETTHIVVHVRLSLVYSTGFESEIKHLFSDKKADLVISVQYVPDKLDTLILLGNTSNQLYIVGNCSPDEETLFADGVGELLTLSTSEGFHVLAVRA